MSTQYTLVEYMPAHLRASHTAAHNSGVYPHNGAERVYVEGLLSPEQLDPVWCEVIEDCVRELPSTETATTADQLPSEVWAPVSEPREDD